MYCNEKKNSPAFPLSPLGAASGAFGDVLTPAMGLHAPHLSGVLGRDGVHPHGASREVRGTPQERTQRDTKGLKGTRSPHRAFSLDSASGANGHEGVGEHESREDCPQAQP